MTWTINNQPTSFSQTDTTTNPANTNTLGYVTSTLHIANAQYPEHNGVYTCTGANIILNSSNTDSANITVQVRGKLLRCN